MSNMDSDVPWSTYKENARNHSMYSRTSSSFSCTTEKELAHGCLLMIYYRN